MAENPLLKLQEYGQSVWLDFMSRDLVASGKLKQLIDNDGLRGVTSNPAIFEAAFGSSSLYDDEITRLAREGKSPEETYRIITVGDVQKAADVLRPIYDKTGGRDGFVSLEVSPHLAYDTKGTIDEARVLWREISRPNAMIKVPATQPGLEAIRQLISEGININVTLLFGVKRYREVAEAYIAGLEHRAALGEPVENIASVASFFISRIDTLVDPMLESNEKTNEGGTTRQLQGQAAIACGKLAYQAYKEIFAAQRFQLLSAQGAATQRLLWGSTSTKNPNYSDVKYVEDLIGPKTVNTLPLETLEAYRDHGKPAARLEQDADEALQVVENLKLARVDMEQVSQRLEEEGVEKFIKPFDKSIERLREKHAPAKTAGGRR